MVLHEIQALAAFVETSLLIKCVLWRELNPSIKGLHIFGVRVFILRPCACLAHVLSLEMVRVYLSRRWRVSRSVVVIFPGWDEGKHR